ncbi:MAG: riboflavin synthase [Coraliomargaritaceae bacterium]
MFTGIVEETGIVRSFEEQDQAWRLVIEAKLILDDIKLGDSVSINGCCLTVVAIEDSCLSFDLLAESILKTSIKSVSTGSLVNLERALLPTSRMGGHFVSGHVDGLGSICAIEEKGKDTIIEITPAESDLASLKYVVPKGCITLDGISLTVYSVNESSFSVWLIPHTLEVTNLHSKAVGDPINIEYDMFAKYLEKLQTAK